MRHNCLFIIVIFISVFCLRVDAQRDVFGVGVVLGLNIASLPNDESNYNGLNTGIFCEADINKHYNVKTEILFSQNGEYILPKYYPYTDYGKIRLNHIEVPLHFDYYINSYKSTKFLPVWVMEMGISYARLFNYYAEDISRNNMTDLVVYDYKSNVLFQFGTTVYFTEHLGGNLRFSKPIRNNELDITSALRLIYRL